MAVYMSPFTSSSYSHFVRKFKDRSVDNPFRTAVPLWGQTRLIPNSLPPKRVNTSVQTVLLTFPDGLVHISEHYYSTLATAAVPGRRGCGSGCPGLLACKIGTRGCTYTCRYEIPKAYNTALP